MKTAFFNGNLEEHIFMEQAEGFLELGIENLLCKLKKSYRGLSSHHDNGTKSSTPT